jgi:hypothetical protein
LKQSPTKKLSKANKEMIKKLETFNWDLADKILDEYRKRAKLRGALRYMQWEATKPFYPTEQFKIVRKLFNYIQEENKIKINRARESFYNSKLHKNKWKMDDSLPCMFPSDGTETEVPEQKSLILGQIFSLLKAINLQITYESFEDMNLMDCFDPTGSWERISEKIANENYNNYESWLE